MKTVIESIRAYEILSGHGKPTVEVELRTNTGIVTTGSVPSGTSRGGFEAFEIKDGSSRYGGNGVRRAVEIVNMTIAPKLTGLPLDNPFGIDRLMIDMDHTADKSALGGNTILPISTAVHKAAAASYNLEPFEYLGGCSAITLPIPIATVIAGGEYSLSKGLDFEDFIIIPHGFDSFSESLEMITLIRIELESYLRDKYGNVQDTGGALTTSFDSNESAFDAISYIINRHKLEGTISIGIDVAANEIFNSKSKKYNVCKKEMNVEELIFYYKKLCNNYPIIFIEDAFEENDFESFKKLKQTLPGMLIVGDDLYASNINRLRTGYAQGSTNSILLKINQIGTITEALETAAYAKNKNLTNIVSLRSNETCDTFIGDFAVGIESRMIKLGSPVRGERLAKYNRLLSIEDKLIRSRRYNYQGMAK